MKNLVSMNTPYMLVFTRGLSLNGWIKNENMQLKVSFYRKGSKKKKNFSRRKTKEKTEKVQFPNYLSLT